LKKQNFVEDGQNIMSLGQNVTNLRQNHHRENTLQASAALSFNDSKTFLVNQGGGATTTNQSMYMMNNTNASLVEVDRGNRASMPVQ
jgi:hypothetical protein